MIRRWLSTLLKLAVTLGLLWLLLRKVDIAAAWAAMKDISPWALVAALALQVLQMLLSGLRWRMVLDAIGSRLSVLRATLVFVIGNFFGQVLPGAVGGDVVRMWLATRSGVPAQAAIDSVLLERLLTLFGLTLLVAAGEPALAHVLPDQRGLWLFPVLTVALAGGGVVAMLLDRVPARFGALRLVKGAARLAEDSRALLLAPARCGGTLLVVILGHLNLGLINWVLARGLHIEIGLFDCILLTLPAILVATLPISIAGWGARELVLVTLLGLVGVAPSQALALSVLFGLETLAITLPGGLLWLLQRDRHVVPVEGLSGEG